MNENTIQETTSNNDKITKPNRQADVLDQTRLRPPSTVLRYSYDGKIVSLLLNLKSLGKGRFQRCKCGIDDKCMRPFTNVR
jgi:hypothetical protein